MNQASPSEDGTGRPETGSFPELSRASPDVWAWGSERAVGAVRGAGGVELAAGVQAGVLLTLSPLLAVGSSGLGALENVASFSCLAIRATSG